MDAEKNIQIERREGDEILRGTLMDGQGRIMMCDTTQMVQRAADIHHATPVCTAAMGRLMTATSMLGVMMKGENESVTVNVKGGGPMGTVVAVAIISLVSNSMLILGIDTYWQQFFNGLGILVGVTVSALQAKRQKQ